MKNKFTIISLILTIIIVLPALFFSGYEISRMNKSEKEIESIYNKQLDAILFSINQYSEDIISSWVIKINTSQSYKGKPECGNFKELFSIVPQIKSVLFCEYKTKYLITSCINDTAENINNTIDKVKKLLTDSSKKVDRLAQYIKVGYQKNEPLGINKENSSIFIVFMIKGENNLKQLPVCIIEIDAERFIKELLGQKIQITAEDRFNIAIINSGTNNILYPVKIQNRSQYQFDSSFNFQHTKPLWLFPQYKMGIQLKGKTINILSKERTRLNLLMIVLVDIIFIIGAFFIFRNLRKEMKLTLIKSEFISNVSHEIRTPLALISMYIETLEMDRIKSEEKRKEYYKVILNETQRLSGLVNKILNFSKIESGKRKFTFENLDLNEVVEKVMHSYKFHLSSKGFEINFELTEQLPLIFADNEAISDCIVNLIDNAIKYSKDSKFINIKTGKKGDFVYIEVTDKGIGIAKEDHKLVFDKFFRVTKGDNIYEVKGTGLGLTIVKNIIDSHKGKIELESKTNEGSTFRILIPYLKNSKP